MVVALTRVTMAAADGVSVSLRRNGRLSTVAASDQVILDMDTYQYATGEGPCIDASVEGRRFQTQSLADETRWPAFTPKAHSLGISAILSTPLTASQEPVGALNIYSHRPSVFGTAGRGTGVAVRGRDLDHPDPGRGRHQRRGARCPHPGGASGTTRPSPRPRA